jgi:hypothetical protein
VNGHFGEDLGSQPEGFEMWWYGSLIVLAVIGAATVLFYAVRTLAERLRQDRVDRARALFQQRREWLEAEFLTRAAHSGKPRGLDWVDCDFDDNVWFARDRHNGQLRALVGVTISFQATPGGGMEDVEAVRNLRSATAVFRYDRKHWITEGRAIFNLSPDETIRHFGHELEPV